MTINVWDYLKEYESEKEAIHSAIEKVLTSGQLILGENVRNFEQAFAAYCGCKFAVGVNSGTDALFLGLKALDIGSGDEVITVANTAVPTISSIVSTGATPAFVDIDPDTYLMDTSKLARAVTQRTKCILPVHLYGQCANMDAIMATAKKYDLKVIEDCAQSHGAVYKGKKAGSMSDIAAFSFYPTKVLGCYGDGGMVVTNDEKIYMRLRRLRFYGMEKTYYALEHGYNSRLDELQAAILFIKLSHIDQYIKARRSIAERYMHNLQGTGLSLPHVMSGNDHVYHLFVCRHHERDRIISELRKRNIFVNIHYPWPIHMMPAYSYIGYIEGDLPHTEKSSCEIFSLPMYPSLTVDEQGIVIDSLIQILKSLY